MNAPARLSDNAKLAWDELNADGLLATRHYREGRGLDAFADWDEAPDIVTRDSLLRTAVADVTDEMVLNTR
jgi:hypothetical protein